MASKKAKATSKHTRSKKVKAASQDTRSIIERQAPRSSIECHAIITAREISEDLVARAQSVYAYLHGQQGSVFEINDLRRDVNRIYEEMHCAITARQVRLELSKRK